MTDLDDLMLRIDKINAKSPPLSAQDIDDLIAFHRHNRSRKASGQKSDGPKLTDVIKGLRPKQEVTVKVKL